MDSPTGPSPGRLKSLTRLAHAVFFLSGISGLAYEVSWSRQIGLVMGHTASAAALVLAAYFAGLALGQVVGARAARRVRPLIAYGIAEILTAGWACLIPGLTAWAGSISDIGASPEAGAAVRGMLCLAILLPATIPLGATFPLMAEFLSSPGRGGGRLVTFAYALNTAGGLVGVVAAILLMAPVGVRLVGYLAAGLSGACGLAACVLSAVRRSETGTSKETVLPVRDVDAVSWGWMTVAAVSGFTTLGLEVLYTRLFALIFHNSTYTFGAVLAVFLAGLGLGAAAATALGRRFAPRALAVAGCTLGAVAVAASVILFVRVTRLEYFAAGDTFAEYIAGAFALVAVIVLPPVTLLGVVLPAAFLALGTGGGRAAGRLAAVNTVAAAAGALAAGYVWTPWFGLWGAFSLLSCFLGLTGVAMLPRSRRIGLAGGLATATVAAALMIANPGQAPAWAARYGEEVVRRWETPYGWIDVIRTSKDGSLKVRQNLHYRHGSTGANAVREYRQGRLPLLLHSDPSDVAFLGLGTGLTAAPAVADRDVRRAVVIELIPEVVEAARLLSDANLGLVDQPKVEVRVDDARHYLLRTDRRFDVIVSDLFVPWESRTGYLYTVEHYAAARRRLRPGGLFCQWVALYQVGPEEFELIADSFASVFPETTLWWGHLDPQFGIVALIGGDRPLDADPARLDARWDALGTMPGGPDQLLGSPSDLPGLYLGRWPGRPGRRSNSDEHPWVEFSAPISHRSDRTLKGKTLRSYFDEVLAELPPGGIRFGMTADSETAAQGRRRALQRLILFGSAARRSDARKSD